MAFYIFCIKYTSIINLLSVALATIVPKIIIAHYIKNNLTERLFSPPITFPLFLFHLDRTLLFKDVIQVYLWCPIFAFLTKNLKEFYLKKIISVSISTFSTAFNLKNERIHLGSRSNGCCCWHGFESRHCMLTWKASNS